MKAPADRQVVAAMILLAFALRTVVRVAGGEAAFLTNGYTFYLEIARTFISGNGFCFSPGVQCAVRVPVYPVLLLPFLATGSTYPALVVVEAAMGASLAWVAWRLGHEMFGRRAGLLAAALTAFNPYAIVHDTSLQDTVVFNLLIATAIYLLVRFHRTRADSSAVGAGLSLALAQLTTARMALFLPCALVWVAWTSGPGVRSRLRAAALVGLPVLLLVGGWVVRNWRLVGTPVLTTESGESFWLANNSVTADFLPDRSIDLTLQAALDNLRPDERARLDSLTSELARDRLKQQWGSEYVRSHPAQTLWGAARKLGAAVSGQLSPARGRLTDIGYVAFFFPINVLAMLGLWRAGPRRGPHALVLLVFASFAVTTAVFWAHTSHKSYLDPLLFVYAASCLFARPAGHARTATV